MFCGFLVTSTSCLHGGLASSPCCLALDSSSSFPCPAFRAIAKSLQDIIRNRKHPLYITHIRSHTGLPGPLAQGNDEIDKLLIGNVLEASEFHKKHHVNSKGLKRDFSITWQQAKEIVRKCPTCSFYNQTPLPAGCNPKGTQRNDIWQMDVFHFAEFGKLKYVHHTIDTYSGFQWATALSSEKVDSVITHLLEVMAIMGIPAQIKTDNAPAYVSGKMKQFFAYYNIKHITGIPHNPKGQAVIERSNRTLKDMLNKQKGVTKTPRNRLHNALLTLNFLNANEKGTTAAERHWIIEKTAELNQPIYFKDVLTSEWKPGYVLRWGRGFAFISTGEDKLWIPSKLIKDFASSCSRALRCERIGTGDQFLNITPTAQTLSATINQWDYMKLRSFCKAKDTITKTKHQPTEWEKIFTNPTSDRGLISRIYKELKKHDIKTPNSPIEKWAIELNREFTAEEYRMAERHLRKCSTSLLIREMQIKTTLRYHLTPVRMAKIKNTGTVHVGEDVEQEEHFSTVGGNADWYNHYGKQYGEFSENWESFFLQTQPYHSWAYTQRMPSHTTRTHTQLCS
ncbi:hypothetical protein STEG23_015755 [Scotinomys teguina]